jgi:hypothetical protein
LTSLLLLICIFHHPKSWDPKVTLLDPLISPLLSLDLWVLVVTKSELQHQ